MVTRAVIEEFLRHKHLALVGASRNGQGFGNFARKELQAQGYDLHLVHPEADAIEGRPCAHHLADVAEDVEGVILVTPPAQTEKLVEEAYDAGLRRVWIQQGAESEAAVKFCEERGMEVVHHECVLMFVEHPGVVHRAHRFLRKAFGHLPA